MRYLLTTTFAAVIGLLMVQPAQAASPAGNSFYAAFEVGPLFTQEFDLIGITIDPDVGYHIGGALGGWIGPNYRSEIAAGWRSYETDVIPEISSVRVSWNNYFHVLEGAHQPWFGFGAGVMFTSVDDPDIADTFKTSVLLSAMAGYDFYLSGLPGNIKDAMGDAIGGSSILDNIAVGVGYRFSWGNPRLSSERGPLNPIVSPAVSTAVRDSVSNAVLKQQAHEILFSARYEF